MGWLGMQMKLVQSGKISDENRRYACHAFPTGHLEAFPSFPHAVLCLQIAVESKCGPEVVRWIRRIHPPNGKWPRSM
jgi:hypothetical protein